jgi:hypothetical protein
MKSSGSSFSDFMDDQRDQALLSMLTKARQSNHIAKITTGSDRKRAYDLKCRTLSEAITFAPSHFVIDIIEPKEGIIGIEGPSGFRFHVPVASLSSAARQTLASQVTSLFN